MKPFWIFIIGVLVVAGLIALQKYGIINWQAITILIAALAAPFKFFGSLFKTDESKIQAITDQHQAVRNAEYKYQKELEDKIMARDARVEALNNDIQGLNSKLKTLEEKNSTIEQLINTMPPEEKKQKFKDLLGE